MQNNNYQLPTLLVQRSDALYIIDIHREVYTLVGFLAGVYNAQKFNIFEQLSWPHHYMFLS